jgi:hypothetical protein
LPRRAHCQALALPMKATDWLALEWVQAPRLLSAVGPTF